MQLDGSSRQGHRQSNIATYNGVLSGTNMGLEKFPLKPFGQIWIQNQIISKRKLVGAYATSSLFSLFKTFHEILYQN